MASGALLHFRNLSAPDPHGVTEDEAAAAHVYTQDTLFFRVLNEQLRGTDRSKVEPYKPYTGTEKKQVVEEHRIQNRR